MLPRCRVVGLLLIACLLCPALPVEAARSGAVAAEVSQRAQRRMHRRARGKSKAAKARKRARVSRFTKAHKKAAKAHKKAAKAHKKTAKAHKKAAKAHKKTAKAHKKTAKAHKKTAKAHKKTGKARKKTGKARKKAAKAQLGRRSRRARRARRPRRPRCRARGKDRWPPIKLFQANLRERLSLRIRDRCGNRLSAARRRLISFLRCVQTKRRHAIDWRLIDNLYQTYLAFGRREIVVYSGFRGRAVARLKESYHTKGKAIDFRIAGVSRARLRDYLLKTFKKVGVGYYTKVPFVHMDVRPQRSAFWIDFSGSGEAPRYAHNAYALLKKERRGIPIRERQRVFVVIAEPAGQGRAAKAKARPRMSPATIAPIPPLPVLPGTPPATKRALRRHDVDPASIRISELSSLAQPIPRGASTNATSPAAAGVARRSVAPRSGFGRRPR